MPILAYALVSVGDLKTFLGISTSAYDEVLTMLINQATDYIEKKCGRRFLQTTYTNEEYSGYPSKDLVLNQFPVITFSSLQENNVTDNSDSWETVDADDYWVDNNAGIVTRVSSFRKGNYNYRVTYSAGYASGNIPYDLQYACCALASEVYTQRKATGIKSETLGDHSITFEAIVNTNPRILEIINRYRKVTLVPAC